MADAGTPKAVTDEHVEELVSDLEDLIDECPAGECCPPSTADMVIMGAGTLVVFVVLFFLMVRLVERVFIRRGSSPLLGRHLGISAALFLGTLGMVGIFFLVTGCWYGRFTYWAIFAGIVWGLHFLYTMFAVRRA